jgi:hypothetical protein
MNELNFHEWISVTLTSVLGVVTVIVVALIVIDAIKRNRYENFEKRRRGW